MQVVYAVVLSTQHAETLRKFGIVSEDDLSYISRFIGIPVHDMSNLDERPSTLIPLIASAENVVTHAQLILAARRRLISCGVKNAADIGCAL